MQHVYVSFQALLQLLGYSRPGPQPTKPALRSPGDGGGEKGRKVRGINGRLP